MSALYDLATQAQNYQKLHEEGQLSDADFVELINDLNIVGNINANADVEDQDQEYHAILMDALSLAQALS
jgi:hypothetical protein